MATYWISEYQDLGSANGYPVQVPKEPAIANQSSTYTTATLSSAFNAETRYVGIRADAVVHPAFGDNTVVADATYLPQSAGEVRYYAVNPGDYVSLYDGTS